MQPEPGRDDLPLGRAWLVAALALAALALAWAGAGVWRAAQRARCLGFWDDGAKIVVIPATEAAACGSFSRSICYGEGFDDAPPVRYVSFDADLLPLLRIAYGAGGHGQEARAERCGDLVALAAPALPDQGALLSERLAEARVEIRHLDGKKETLARVRERFSCGRGRSWCWIGASARAGVPVLRVHLVQDARVLITLPRREQDGRLELRVGFSDDAERLRAPLFGLARVKIRGGERTLFARVIWPGFGARGGVVDLRGLPVDAPLEIVLEGIGSRFGEIWLAGRFSS